MANGWTLERKKRQAALIHTWNPSNRSTGPRTNFGKARSCLNAFKHGARSKQAMYYSDFYQRILECHRSAFNQILAKVKK